MKHPINFRMEAKPMTKQDYLAISNTGKNISISMTPGMKQRILGNHGHLKLRYVRGGGHPVLVPSGPGLGYQMIRRKSVWNMSVASKRFPYWPKHERVVLDASQVDMTEHGAIIMLPKPAANDYVNSIAAETHRAARESAPARWDYRNMYAPTFVEDAPQKECRQFNFLDMVVAAITGGAIGVVFALMLAAAGLVSCGS